MTIETLQAAMIAAMKNKDKARKDTLSSLIGAVKKTAIDKKCKDSITEDLVNEVVLKEKKTVQEMIDTCPEERTDLLVEYQNRLKIVDEFAPKMMSEDEIHRFIELELAENAIDASSKNKGLIMKTISPKLKGKADMKLVNQVLSSILS